MEETNIISDNTKRLIELLKQRNIEYRVINHKAEGISSEVAEIRGNKPEEGCKAILFRWKTISSKDYILCCVLGNLKVDVDKVKNMMNYSDIRMANLEELYNETKCQKGEVPPFGELFNIQTIIDNELLKNEYIYFNAASFTMSVCLHIDEFKKLVVDNNKYRLENISDTSINNY